MDKVDKRTITKSFVDENGRKCTRCGIYFEWIDKNGEKNYSKNYLHKTGYTTRCNACVADVRKEAYVPKERKPTHSFGSGGYYSDEYSVTPRRFSY